MTKVSGGEGGGMSSGRKLDTVTSYVQELFNLVPYTYLSGSSG